MSNVTYTVPNKNSSYDGDMVLKQYTSMTINNGDTVTVDQPCRGLFIYVTGNCTINGTLSMNHRGAFANPTSSGGSDNNAVDSNGLRLPMLTSGGSDTLTVANTLFNGCGNAVRSAIANQTSISGNGTILKIERENTDRQTYVGQTANSSSQYAKLARRSTISNSTGTGGAGGYWMNNAYNYADLANAGKSSCFGGGSGGGGWNGNGNSTSSMSQTNAVDYGGEGGSGGSNHGYNGMGGGAGNPRGGDYGNVGISSQTGNGGVIWLIVGGNLTIGSSGIICADGSNGGGVISGGDFNSGGGASGGGRIIIAHKGTYTNNGTVQANGGTGGQCVAGYSQAGQDGMNGAITVQQVL